MFVTHDIRRSLLSIVIILLFEHENYIRLMNTVSKEGAYKRTQTAALNTYLGSAAVDKVPQ